jgi:thiamine pyrophosphokinase
LYFCFFFFFFFSASLRVAVDGGANRWFHFLQGTDYVVPELVTGDFDSIKQNVLSYFKSKGSEVIPTPNQDETDFTKALRVIQSIITSQNLQV